MTKPKTLEQLRAEKERAEAQTPVITFNFMMSTK